MHKFKNFYKFWVNVCLALMLLGINPSLFQSDPSFHDALENHSPLTVTVSSLLPNGFTSSPITPEIEARIRGISYPENCPVPLSSLRYLTVLHIGFDGQTHVGELIVHEQIARPVLEIFHKLYLANYPIEKIRLIDDYNANDEASMTDNNTSAFCCRPIAGTATLSLHSYGLAVDINPLYNPYVNGDLIAPATSAYDRETGTVLSPHFMTEENYCVKLFQAYGFTWGGEWNGLKDYQHFEYNRTVSANQISLQESGHIIRRARITRMSRYEPLFNLVSLRTLPYRLISFAHFSTKQNSVPTPTFVHSFL